MFSVLKFTVSTFIILSPITKLGFGTANVLFPMFITFYKIYCVYGIAIKWFANVISFVRTLLSQLTKKPFLTALTRIICFIYLR